MSGLAVVYTARAFYPGTRKARHLAWEKDLGRHERVGTLCGHPAVHIVKLKAGRDDATCPICRLVARTTKEEELNQEAEWAAITELIAAAKDAEMCLRAAPFGGHTVSLRLRKALAALRTTKEGE